MKSGEGERIAEQLEGTWLESFSLSAWGIVRRVKKG